MKTLLFLVLTLAATSASLRAQDQTEYFTYQGELVQNGQPANGQVDMTFSLFDAETGGDQVGVTFIYDKVAVSNGLFSVPLYWAPVLNGSQTWIEITAGGQVLSPRQKLFIAPVAGFALNGARAIDYNAILPPPSGSPVFLNSAGDFVLTALCTKDSGSGDVTLAVYVTSQHNYDARLVSTAQTNDAGTISTTPLNGTNNPAGTGTLISHTSTNGNYRRIWLAPVVLHSRGPKTSVVTADLYLGVDARAASAGCVAQGTLANGI